MSPHYTPDLHNRFWSKVNKDGPVPADASLGPCWIWTAANNGRYGNLGIVENGRQRLLYAHRAAYEIANAMLLPDNVCVCHRCDVPLCVNPAHLFLGTNASNSADMARKGRSTRGPRNPMAKLTEADVREIRRRVSAGEPRKVVAAAFNTTPRSIWQIDKRLRWKHVA